MVSIDHFYVFAAPGAPEQQRLIEHGLQIGMQREHAGQGTRNACFSFADCYLELLWVDDYQQAQNATSKPLRLNERMNWRVSNASPFGVCLRGDNQSPPFAHWHYRPDYLPDDMSIAIARCSDVIEAPMLFQIERAFEPFGNAHALSSLRLHSLVITTPALSATSQFSSLDIDRLQVVPGDEHLMTVTLQDEQGETGEQRLDLRPNLPVVLRW